MVMRATVSSVRDESGAEEIEVQRSRSAMSNHSNSVPEEQFSSMSDISISRNLSRNKSQTSYQSEAQSLMSSVQSEKEEPAPQAAFIPQYKQDILEEIIRNAQDPNDPSVSHDQVLEILLGFGIKVYEIDHTANIRGNLFKEIKEVVENVSTYSRAESNGELSQSCLLYRDHNNRLFNLTIQGGSMGLEGSWKNSLATFSGLEAMIGMTVLTRSFTCALQDEVLGVRPAYLSLLLGLVLSEEISLAHLNITMLVWGAPSISSYELLFQFSSDWPRKLIVFVLAMAGAAEGLAQKYLTVFGVAFACGVFATNLGSRAWYNLKLRPVEYSGYGCLYVSTVVALCTGLTVPYLGFREVTVGGQTAMITIIKSAVIVAILFMVSDIDYVQKFIIVGSENCNQDIVNVAVASWWSLSLITSIFFSHRLLPRVLSQSEEKEFTRESVVEEASDSPVGFKVKHLPDFPVERSLTAKGGINFSMNTLRIFGLLVSILVGGAMLFFSYHDLDDRLTGYGFL